MHKPRHVAAMASPVIEASAQTAGLQETDRCDMSYRTCACAQARLTRIGACEHACQPCLDTVVLSSTSLCHLVGLLAPAQARYLDWLN